MPETPMPAPPVPEPPVPEPPVPEPPPGPDDRVPLFGTWTAIHVAVAVSAVLVMLLLALFSRWPF